ncbi:integrase [Aeromonas rivipollensis]|uniref:integrase n=1 Tax=Aeromonas rivipollensis TaxID=948519 RepID=UPI0038D0343C
MDNIELFKPKVALTSEQNLNDFVSMCRDKLTAFGKDCWDENQWNDFYGSSNRKVVARFSTITKPFNSYKYEPMAKPFIDFAKAYIRYSYSFQPVSNLHRHMDALRYVEEALLKVKDKADILELDGEVINTLHDIMLNHISSKDSLNKSGYQVELLLDFCRSQYIAPSLPQWINPFPRQRDLTIELDDEGREHRASKLPSNEEMMQVAALFCEAPNLDLETEFYTAVMALLMVAPGRASELFSLSTDCLVWEDDSAGVKRLGIRWNPAKNGKAGLKWVPSVMNEIVIEAVERLKRIGEPARKAAIFAEEYPNLFMQHEDCVGDPVSNETPLTLEQFNAAMGVQIESLESSKNNTKWIKEILGEGNEVTYKKLGEYSYKKYVSSFNNWPYADAKSQTKVSDALLLFRDVELHKAFRVKGYSFVQPTVNNINDRINATGARANQSLWHKHGIKLANGDPIMLTSHMARHWLCTKLERGGMDELILANWAGRARVADNKSYDHRSEEEKCEDYRTLSLTENYNVLDKIKTNLPVTYEDIGKNQTGVALVTELGVCEHDFAMMPCQRNGDCETCKELVCIKGYSSSLELLKKREQESSEQFNHAKKNHEMGAFGADRWVSNLGWRLSHLRTKIRMLEDKRIPDGTPLRIPDEYDPSPIKNALLEKGLNTNVATPESITLSDDLHDLLGY